MDVPYKKTTYQNVAVLQGKSHKEAIMKIRQMYWTALKMSWRVWIVFQYVNLNYVPIQVTNQTHFAHYLCTSLSAVAGCK